MLSIKVDALKQYPDMRTWPVAKITLYVKWNKAVRKALARGDTVTVDQLNNRYMAKAEAL